MRFERYDQETLVKVVDENTGAELSTQSVEACLLYEILVTMQEIRGALFDLDNARDGIRRVK